MEYLIPRLLCAFLSGVVMSQTGSLIQMGTRNILASPSTLGFDGLSVLWILILHSILLFFNFDLSHTILILGGIPVFIFMGTYFSSFMIRLKKFERIILLGLTFNLLVGAIFALWQFLFLAFNLPFPIELWFGHFRFATLENGLILFVFELFILVGWFLLKKEFYLQSLGPRLANKMNLREKSLYNYLFISVSLGTFLVVGLFGAFSFLGLVFPIVARKLWFKKWDLEGEILIGATFNGAFLMIVDLICYYFPIHGAEVPVGLIATVTGAVCLIMILWTSDRPMETLAKKQK